MAGSTLGIASDMSDVPTWTGYGAQHSVASNVLTITLPASTSAYYPVTHPISGMNLTGSQVAVNLQQRTNQDTGSTETQIVLQIDANNQLLFIVSGTLLTCRERSAGSNSDASGGTYNSTSMAWLRFREAAGTIYWEYAASPAGPWTVARSKAPAIAVTSFSLQLVAGAFNASNTTPGAAKFANLNLPHPRSFFF